MLKIATSDADEHVSECSNAQLLSISLLVFKNGPHLFLVLNHCVCIAFVSSCNGYANALSFKLVWWIFAVLPESSLLCCSLRLVYFYVSLLCAVDMVLTDFMCSMISFPYS